MRYWLGLAYSGPGAHTVVISLISECIIGVDTFGNEKKYPNSALDYVVRTFLKRKTNWRPLNLPYD